MTNSRNCRRNKRSKQSDLCHPPKCGFTIYDEETEALDAATDGVEEYVFKLVEFYTMADKRPDRIRMVIPMLVCRDGASEIDFCKTTFGAVELSRRSAPDGSVVHATLKIGESMLMIHGEVPALASRAPQSDGSSSVVIYIYVDDVDGMTARAAAAGARVLIPVANQFWGDRVGRIIDPAGHVWNISTRIAEASSVPPGSAS
jgi:PhnB protein